MYALLVVIALFVAALLAILFGDGAYAVILVIAYFLVALLGARLSKGWLASRPALAWIVVGAGVLALAVLLAAHRLISDAVILFVIPPIVSMAAGVAVGRTAMPALARVLVLLVAIVGVTLFCAVHVQWEGI
jgi:hypothetical protein